MGGWTLGFGQRASHRWGSCPASWVDAHGAATSRCWGGGRAWRVGGCSDDRVEVGSREPQVLADHSAWDSPAAGLGAQPRRRQREQFASLFGCVEDRSACRWFLAGTRGGRIVRASAPWRRQAGSPSRPAADAARGADWLLAAHAATSTSGAPIAEDLRRAHPPPGRTSFGFPEHEGCSTTSPEFV